MVKTKLVGFMALAIIMMGGNSLDAMEFGMKAGMSSVNLSLSRDLPGIEFHSRTEFIAGGFISVNLVKNLSIQPEAIYAKKGVNGKEVDETSTFTFSYIEFPLLIKFAFPASQKITPVLFAGPYAAWKLNAEVIELENGVREETDLADFTKKTDFGLVFGGSLEYSLKAGKIVVDFRYSLGMVNAMKNLDILTEGIMDKEDCVKTRSLSIMIGFAF